jgi:hypothetical protein
VEDELIEVYFTEAIRDALPLIRAARFPGFALDEVDAFEIGFWSGAMALGAALMDEDGEAKDVSARVLAELARIESWRETDKPQRSPKT